MKISEFKKNKSILLIVAGTLLISLNCCQPNKNDLALLADYFQVNGMQAAADLNGLPLFINWEHKTEKYWIGEALIEHPKNEKYNCRVLALFEHNSLLKLQFSCDISEPNTKRPAIQELLELNNAEIIDAHLNSAINPYKLWKFTATKPFWLQVGQSYGSRLSTEFYCFYFSLDCLKENL